jgi:hypothetical protein
MARTTGLWTHARTPTGSAHRDRDRESLLSGVSSDARGRRVLSPLYRIDDSGVHRRDLPNDQKMSQAADLSQVVRM